MPLCVCIFCSDLPLRMSSRAKASDSVRSRMVVSLVVLAREEAVQPVTAQWRCRRRSRNCAAGCGRRCGAGDASCSEVDRRGVLKRPLCPRNQIAPAIQDTRAEPSINWSVTVVAGPRRAFPEVPAPCQRWADDHGARWRKRRVAVLMARRCYSKISGGRCGRGLALARGLPLRVCFRGDDPAPPHVHFARAKPERFQLVVHRLADAVGGAELRDRVGVALAARWQRPALALALL